MNILLIEDEEKQAKAIQDWFGGTGDEVTFFLNGEDGLRDAIKKEYDCIILDVMLPGKDGFSILKELRNRGREVPVLMLTSRADIQDKLTAFNGGAQDYLTKPFDFKELEARLKIIASKSSFEGRIEDQNLSGNLILDYNQTALVNHETGNSVKLSAKEFRLMEYFFRNEGQLLTKEQIDNRVWGLETDVNYNNTEVYISFLRKKLDHVEADKKIETVRGMGYKFR